MSSNLFSLRRSRPMVGLVAIISIVTFCVFLEPLSSMKHSPFSSLNFTTSETLAAFYQELNNTEDEATSIDDNSIWCLHMAHRLDSDQYLLQSPVLRAPALDGTKLHRLPYYYHSRWKSSPLIPRRMTQCEHSMAMRLLTVIDRICRRHKIEYMLSDGTLLGSLRHHDLIPWDTDVDVMVSDKDKDRFLDEVRRINESLVLHRILGKNHKQYYKLFLRNTPSAGGLPWNFPFVDIFVYVQNETHVWHKNEPEEATEKKYYYPLVLRPLGELWLPAPRAPRKLYDFDPFDDCKTHWWNHRNETGEDVISRKCNELRAFYPFVEYGNRSNSTEVLKINNTIVHTVVYN